MKRLVLTADDFGLCTGVNKAVEKAWRDGLLTVASVMPGADRFDEAVEIAAANPGLQIGLHLTLVQGKPVSPPGDIPGLVTPQGTFPENPVAAGISLYFDRSLRDQLYREIEAQIIRVKSTGLELSHIDGHLNIHLHPTVFSILTELMPKHGIRSIRLSRERLLHNLRHDRTRILGKSLETFIFGALSSSAQAWLDAAGFTFASEVKGVLNSGRMTEAYLINMLDGVYDGLNEIYFHPGILPDPEITKRMPDYRHEEELAALLSGNIRIKMKELGISLCNYRGEIKPYA